MLGLAFAMSKLSTILMIGQVGKSGGSVLIWIFISALVGPAVGNVAADM